MKKFLSLFMAVAIAFVSVNGVSCFAEEVESNAAVQAEESSFAEKAKDWAKEAYQVTKNGLGAAYDWAKDACQVNANALKAAYGFWISQKTEEKLKLVAGASVILATILIPRCCFCGAAPVKQQVANPVEKQEN